VADQPNVFNFWSKISNIEEAKEYTRSGFVAALFCAGVTLALVLLHFAGASLLPGFDAFALFDVALFAGFAWGIYRYSRICAILALVLYVGEQANNIVNFRTYNAVLAVLFIMFFIKSIRGTFAYHRFKAASSSVSVPDA
jgi:serine/threonine-protein kinase